GKTACEDQARRAVLSVYVPAHGQARQRAAIAEELIGACQGRADARRKNRVVILILEIGRLPPFRDHRWPIRETGEPRPHRRRWLNRGPTLAAITHGVPELAAAGTDVEEAANRVNGLSDQRRNARHIIRAVDCGSVEFERIDQRAGTIQCWGYMVGRPVGMNRRLPQSLLPSISGRNSLAEHGTPRPLGYSPERAIPQQDPISSPIGATKRRHYYLMRTNK